MAVSRTEGLTSTIRKDVESRCRNVVGTAIFCSKISFLVDFNNNNNNNNNNNSNNNNNKSYQPRPLDGSSWWQSARQTS